MSRRGPTLTRVVLALLAAIHLVAVTWHGAAHTRLGVTLSPLQNAFVYTVVVSAPVVAVGLLWTRHVGAGLWLFLVASCGALGFGGYYHYVVVSPDHVGHLPAGSPAAQAAFARSAAVLALTELAGALAAAFGLGWHQALRRQPRR